MSEKIKSCYMDEQPLLGEEVYDDDNWIATIKAPSKIDMLLITNYGRENELSKIFPASVKALITSWASEKPIGMEGLAELSQNCQNEIYNKIMKVISEANQTDEAVSKN